MKMYIEPFWMGVISTILVEIAALILGTLIIARKNKKGK